MSAMEGKHLVPRPPPGPAPKLRFHREKALEGTVKRLPRSLDAWPGGMFVSSGILMQKGDSTKLESYTPNASQGSGWAWPTLLVKEHGSVRPRCDEFVGCSSAVRPEASSEERWDVDVGDGRI